MVTNLAYNRKFERSEVDGTIIRRAVPIPSFTKVIGMCFLCNHPVMGSPGQYLKKTTNGLYSHKACRKNK